MNLSRPSLPATCLGLLSMITLLATMMLSQRGADAAWVLVVCIGALLGTHLTAARLSRSSYVPLLVRLLCFPTLFLLGGTSSLGIDWIFQPQTLYMLGQIAAVEGCLQHWKSAPSVAQGRYSPSVLLLWSLVYLCGSNVMANWGSMILLTTPLFIVLLGWSLLDWKPARLDRRAQAAVAACWGVALVGGFGLHKTAMIFKNELMGIGSQLVRENMARSVAGISNRPKLGSSFDISDSERRVLRVEGELGDPHLRAASFDSYQQDGSWSPPLSSRSGIEADAPESRLKAAPGQARTTKASITRLADMNGDPVLAPLNMVALRALEVTNVDGQTYDFEPSTGLMRNSETNPFRYEVTESAQATAGTATFQGPLCEPHGRLVGPERLKYLQLPEGFDERVVRAARVATRGDGTPSERATSLARYLLSNHKYAHDIRIESGSDPIAQFIVGKKDAHCEFFASALVLMCRSVGVPARYVIGYLAHEAALGEPGVLNVRQRDSHAWAEVWIDGVGWVTQDATPGDGRPEARGEVSPAQKWSEWASDLLTRIRNWAARIPRGTWGWAIGVPLALWLIVRGRPQAALRRARAREYAARSGTEAARLEALARDFEKWMAAQKLAPLPSRSWQWFLQREQREAAALWARDYEATRFGHATPRQLERLEFELAALRSPKARP